MVDKEDRRSQLLAELTIAQQSGAAERCQYLLNQLAELDEDEQATDKVSRALDAREN